MSMPSDKWVTASEWQSYWRLDQVGIFNTITRGLNTRDNHPPLYFWLLNIWSGLIGINTSTGALLNIPFHILITIMIFILCIKQKYPAFLCASAAVLWMVRYSIIEAGILTRQYSLLGFIVIFFYYSSIRFLQKQTFFNSILICLSALLGLLTHYQFLIIMGIVYIWISVYFFLQKEYSPISKLLFSSLVTTVGGFLAVNPGFFQSFIRQQQGTTISFFHSEIPYLLYRSFYSFAKLFLPEIITISKYSKINMVLFAFFLLGLILYCFRNQSPKKLLIKSMSKDNFVLVTSVISLCMIVFLYVIRVFSVVTMSVKNLMIISPILFIVLAQLLTFFDKINHNITQYFIFLLLFINMVSGIHGTINFVKTNNKQPPPEIFSSSVPIITDQTARGVLPRNLWYVNPSSPVYVTKQDTIIKEFPNIQDYPLIYLISSDNDYDNTPEKQKIVLQLFEDHNYSVKEIGKNIYIEGKLFELKKNISDY